MQSIQSPSYRWRERTYVITAWATIVIGGALSISWLVRVPLWRLLIGGVSPPLTTTMSFLFAGCSLLAWRRTTRTARRVAQGFGVLIALWAGAVVIEHVTEVDLHIDMVSLHSWVGDTNPFPGRSAPVTAFSFLLIGIILALSTGEIARRMRRILGATVLTQMLVLLICYGVLTMIESLPMPRLFGSEFTAWYELPLIHPLIILLLSAIVFNLLWLEQVMPPTVSADEYHSYRVSDLFLGVALSILITVSTVSYSSIRNLQNRFTFSTDNSRMHVAIEDFILGYFNAQSLLNEMTRTTAASTAQTAALQQEIAGLERQLTTLMALQRADLSNDVQPQQSLTALRSALDDLGTLAGQRIEDGTSNQGVPATMATEQSHTATVLREITALRDWQERQQQARDSNSLAKVAFIRALLILGNVVGFIVLVGAFVALLHTQKQRTQLAQDLRRANEELESRVAERTQAVVRVNRELEAMNATLESRVAERTAALAERTSDLEDFSYSVSHDLRAPLRAIDGYALMLEEDHAAALDEEGRQVLQKLRHYVQRMGNLVDDLLRLSRLGRQALRTTAVDMQRMAHDVADELVHQHPIAGATTPELHIDPLPMAQGDISLLRQVWINLIENAIKYSSKVPQPVITISAMHANNEIIYSIRDNGAGFDMAHADKLFGVFQRLHDHSIFGGTGVGLAIVHKIVRRHGGRVWAESRPNAGAMFFFSLPCNEPQTQQAAMSAGHSIQHS